MQKPIKNLYLIDGPGDDTWNAGLGTLAQVRGSIGVGSGLGWVRIAQV
jgi:hypothetical protein